MSNYLTYEKNIRSEVLASLGDSLIKAYSKIYLWRSFLDLAIIYLMLFLVIFLTIKLHTLMGPWILIFTPLFALLSGAAFNWINVQLHEGSHYLLLPKRGLNDVYCNIFFGTLSLQHIDSYRAIHARHHAYLHSKKDPDLHIYDDYINFQKALINDLFLISAFKRHKEVKKFLFDNQLYLRSRKPFYMWVATFIVQLGVIFAFVYFCGLWGIVYFCVFWLYGLLAIFPLLVRIRTVVQHYCIQNDVNGGIATYTSRTTEASFLELILIGARMDYHFEHHILPSIPYYHLKLIHRDLKKRGFFGAKLIEGMELATDSYLKFFYKLKIHRDII